MSSSKKKCRADLNAVNLGAAVGADVGFCSFDDFFLPILEIERGEKIPC